MKEEPFFSGISHSVDSQMAYSRHTLACCLSKPRSSLEAGKKQPKVWLHYACSVAEVFLDEPSGRAERLYPSFGTPLLLLWVPFGDSNFSNKRVQRTFVFNSSSGRKVRSTLGHLFQMSLKNGVKMARNVFEEGSEWCISTNIGNTVNEESKVAPQTHVHLFTYLLCIKSGTYKQTSVPRYKLQTKIL